MKKIVALFFVLMMTGCAALSAVTSLLPDVIACVTDGAQLIDAIERFVDSYFLAHPDPEAQKKVAAAIAKTRGALNVALRAAQGSQALNQQQVDEAFVEFKAAYTELLGLTKPYGVHPASSGRLMATQGGIEVPEPLAFHPKGGVK